MDPFKGTGVALVTPFHRYGTIDFNSLGRLLQHVMAGKVDFLVVMGTTAESVTLSRDERAAVLDFILEETQGAIPVMLGVGGNNTQEVVNTVKALDTTGVGAILSVSPYYNKPQQSGIYNHYKAIAAATSMPVIIYNVPGRTASNVSSETTLRLAHDFSNIIGIKEASGNLVQCMEIIRDRPEGFLVLSGDDILTYPILALGGDGVISVTANAFPGDFSTMVRKALEGDYAKARTLHYRLTGIMDLLFVDGNPSGIKAALEILGICESNVRLPLARISRPVYNQLKSAIASYQDVS